MRPRSRRQRWPAARRWPRPTRRCSPRRPLRWPTRRIPAPARSTLSPWRLGTSTSPSTARPASRPWPTARLPDEDADAYTALADEGDFRPAATPVADASIPEDGGRRPLVLVVSAVAAIFVVGAAALVVALAISMRPTAAVRPDPGHNAVAPRQAGARRAGRSGARSGAGSCGAGSRPRSSGSRAAAPAPAPGRPAPAPAPAAPAPEPGSSRPLRLLCRLRRLPLRCSGAGGAASGGSRPDSGSDSGAAGPRAAAGTRRSGPWGGGHGGGGWPGGGGRGGGGFPGGGPAVRRRRPRRLRRRRIRVPGLHF